MKVIRLMTLSGVPVNFLRSFFILNADTDRAGVRMALPDHDAAHGDQAERSDAKFFGTQDGSDDDVASGLEAAVGAQLDAVAQAVEGQHLIGFGQAHFPWRAGIFDAGLGGCAGAADIAGNQNDVGMRLGNAGGNRADALPH